MAFLDHSLGLAAPEAQRRFLLIVMPSRSPPRTWPDERGRACRYSTTTSGWSRPPRPCRTSSSYGCTGRGRWWLTTATTQARRRLGSAAKAHHSSDGSSNACSAARQDRRRPVSALDSRRD